MNHALKEFFEKKMGLVPVSEAYEEFVNEYGLIDKKTFMIGAHYTGLVRKRQISKKKYFMVYPRNHESLF